MRQAVGCRNCGGGITPDMPEGLCARCLLVPFDDGGAETWPGGDPPASEGGEPPLPQVPRYRVVRLVGTGGIGEVYEAEQDHPRRTVALKLLKGSAGGRETLRRLRYEAEILGRLQHPGIARIYESGAAGRGRPFFAMEFVRGPGGTDPLTLVEYADRERLDVRGRLDLLARVADAVHFAHQHGVVHRDLKPGNILVDEHGQPRVVDFGVARVTGADVQATTLHTQVGQIVGTLAYMSPEQAGGLVAAVDTRSDVYALGALGYELLAGVPPVVLEGMMIHEAVRAIREQEPRRLGTVDPALRGDVETVVAKALEKEKDRRYASAAEFSADVRRCLLDQPIAARPPTAAYYLHKAVRRHRAAACASAAVVLLVGGLSLYGSARIAHDRAAAAAARELARREAADAAAQRRLAEALQAEGLGNYYLRLGRLADARREFAAALYAAPDEVDRDRIRFCLTQADERLQYCFHGTPFRVGQMIRAEHFDTGGEGVSYHDTDGPNAEPHARADTGVDFINGYLSYVRAGEWVQYTVEIPADGDYDFECQGGNTYGAAGILRVEFDGVDKTGPLQVPGPVADYQVFGRNRIRLTAGRQVMRVSFEAEGPVGFVGAINWFKLAPSAEGPANGRTAAEPR